MFLIFFKNIIKRFFVIDTDKGFFLPFACFTQNYVFEFIAVIINRKQNIVVLAVVFDNVHNIKLYLIFILIDKDNAVIKLFFQTLLSCVCILLRGDKFRLIMQQYAASSTESRLIGTMHCRCIYRTLSKHCSGITPIAA